MILLGVSGLEMAFGDKTVLQGITFAVPEGARVGVIGANGYSGLVADPEQATVQTLADHIEYLCDRAGHNRVGLGLDLMIRISGGSDTFTYQGVTSDAFDILPDHSAMDDLRRELAARGWPDRDIAAVVGENWFDFFSRNL